MDLGGLRLSEISQRKTNTVFVLHGESKKTNKNPKTLKTNKLTKHIEKEDRFVVTRGRVWGEGQLEGRWSRGTNSELQDKLVLGM